LLFLAAQAAAPDANEARYESCVALTRTDPTKAVAEADAWRVASGGLLARQCLGLAYVAQERWGPAAIAFEQAARDAEIQRDGRAANLWVQAGNAALAGDDPAKARQLLDRALALPVLSDAMRGEAHIDRARADVASGDFDGARADLDRALALVPADPMAWLLSANLALRRNDLHRAKGHIDEALRLAPDDAAVAYEAGNVAAASHDEKGALSQWERAVKLDPESPVGQAAALALEGHAEAGVGETAKP
jgi:tetratricopeptide (TPR) repeat protein